MWAFISHLYVQNPQFSTEWNMRIALHKFVICFYKYKTYMVAQQPDATGFPTSTYYSLHVGLLKNEKFLSI